MGKWPGSKPSHCDLKDVSAIFYGMAARSHSQVDQASVDPTKCFSLITHKRSCDFICRTDEHVECYVLSLSRLCQKASGGSNFPVEGAIDSHTEFVATRGWCKVEHTCKNKNLDLATAVK